VSEGQILTWGDIEKYGYTLGPPVVEYDSCSGIVSIKRQLFDPRGEAVVVNHGRPNTVCTLTGIATNEADNGESD
jgi:hypothetical protein